MYYIPPCVQQRLLSLGYPLCIILLSVVDLLCESKAFTYVLSSPSYGKLRNDLVAHTFLRSAASSLPSYTNCLVSKWTPDRNSSGQRP